MRKTWLSGLALSALLFSAPASAFVDPPTLNPEHPVAGDLISVLIHAGMCDAFTDDVDETDISIEGNHIRMLVDGIHHSDSAICIYPEIHYVFPVGRFAEGKYALQVDRRYQDFIGPVIIETLAIIPFNVAGAPGQVSAIPALGPFAMGLLVCVLVLGAALVVRRGKLLLIVMVASGIFPTGADANVGRYLEILLSGGASAPTPSAVVEAFENGTPQPLYALDVHEPKSVQYLLPIRASGSLLAWIEANPDSYRAQLERYVIIGYDDESDAQAALAALRNDPDVSGVKEILSLPFSSAELIGFGIEPEPPSGGGQYGRGDLNIDAAWQRAGGYALIGDIDSGLDVTHPALRQFSTSGQYLGGNFIPIASLDIGALDGSHSANVDELHPGPVTNPACDTDGDGMEPPDYAGHGTHVSGLLAANGPTVDFVVQGTCRHCGIAMWKVTYPFCIPASGDVSVNTKPGAQAAALTYLADTGAQIVNMSFGGDYGVPSYCPTNPDPPEALCVAIAYAKTHDVVMVASSGNDRQHLNFPASDERVIAAGGFEEGLALWDESPGNNKNCPDFPPGYPPGIECGSNYTMASGDPMQELMASANAVLSTTYPGFDWYDVVQCGDSFGGPLGDGIGWCTGTSMSAPQISGVVGILRSINPLVPAGRPDFQPLIPPGVRRVLTSTTFEAQNNQPWSTTFGYGHPDAAKAADKMLGKVAGSVVRNRVTPLFRLYSASDHDYADVTSPQYAIAFIINKDGAYQPTGELVPGYESFPTESGTTPLPAPRAAVYVLTTEYKPRAIWPDLVPLHLMDRSNAQGRDFLLVTTNAEIRQAHDDGYNLRNIQGYIYETCTPEPGCKPPDAQKLYRECNTVAGDCATFLESELGAFEGQGYTAPYPPGSSTVLGYAYPAVDGDGDGLIDGFEQVVGTNPDLADSDDDNSDDGMEFPLAGVEVGDPCAGGVGAVNCPANVIFKNGFD